MATKNGVVWAKMRFCPYWPSILVDAPPQVKKVPPKKCCVQFFGTNNYGIIDLSNVISYIPNRSKYIKKGRGKKFDRAVNECDDFIRCPDKILANRTEAIIKREFSQYVQEVDESDEVVANKILDNKCKECVDKQTKLNHTHEKYEAVHRRLIDQNQRQKVRIEELEAKISIECKGCADKQTTINRLHSDKDKYETGHRRFIERNETQKVRIEELEAKISNECKGCADKQTTINQLHSDKEKCETEVRQLNDQIHTQKVQIEDLEAKIAGEYEVESIIGHKRVKGNLLFKVRWKGFDSTEDTFEKRKNLQCPALLNDYLKANSLK